MPIYEYICNSCNKEFSLLQKMGSTEKDTICPHCGSRDVRKLISAFCCSVQSGDSTGNTTTLSGST